MEKPIDLEEVMRYPLSPVPHSLGTSDGFFCKTNKAPMVHYLLSDTHVPDYPLGAMFIQDGNALFHTLKNLPDTYGEICLQVLDNMVAKQNLIFSTDNYEHESIKAQERLRRGFGEKCIIVGPKTVRAPEFKLFLANEDNKKQLCQLLYKVWTSAVSAEQLARCGTAILSVEGLAHSLSAADGEVTSKEVYSLRSNQEETDTRIVLYCHHAAELGFKRAVVRTPDSDVLFILLYHAQNIKLTVYIDIGTGRGRQLVNVSQLATDLGPEYCDTLLGYYVFSVEDCTSSFKGKRKVSPLKKLQKNLKYQAAFR
ncbi:hypothetical protein SKAU_G00274860 [Synaphobranchus kaupii]|uniref:Uncharacterized protein n=1 Tax=Synaphobranchus kaupii TaxID=118154 RepID=A0A9Q1F115_SYNKA|nr:hypothetical protein SKAU_G00274860 [Synaphobranchus kaupii]